MSDTFYAQAVHRILMRIDSTLAEPDQGFPHFADPISGYWTRTANGDWTGGFWNGLLWLAAYATQEKRYHQAALTWTRRLLPRQNSETVFRGFLFWYGAALGSLLCADEKATEIALVGAQGLSQSYNTHAGVIPLGTQAEEASHIGNDECNIDGVPGGTPLLAWASQQTGNETLRTIALTHAQQHVRLCVRDDNSVSQSATIDASSGALLRRYTHKGIRSDSTWGRAQAWGMLGLTQAAHLDAQRFLPIATRVSDWWITHLPSSFVSYWDFDDPTIPHATLDTSATAIAATSLLKLASCHGEQGKHYHDMARSMVNALLTDHLTPIYAGDQRQPGMLINGCYNKRIGLATSNELIWGDYFLLEALLTLQGKLNTVIL